MASTIKEVARGAGVSVATVSRVMNNSGPVRTDTRQRILDVARELRYVPNSTARSLIMARTSTLGILLPDLHGEFFSEVIRGIDHRARQKDYHILVSCSHNDQEDIEAALRAMRGRVDGLIIMSPDIDARVLGDNLPDALPVVLLNCASLGSRFASVDIDNRAGASDMVRHLIGLGHRKIAVVTGGTTNHDSNERLRGYEEAMREAGLGDEIVVVDGEFTEESGFRAGRKLLERPDRPSAIFAFNDSMAVGVLSALQESGVAVPDKISVAGFDDIPMSRYLNPPLTSVQVPIFELGSLAVDRLVGSLRRDASTPPRVEVVSTTLVERRSTGRTQT
jgi:LacI family transcriptional regulator